MVPDLLVLFFGLSISGAIRMRKIHGYRKVKMVRKERGCSLLAERKGPPDPT